MDNLAGKKIGKYQIFNRIGTGGMSQVYKAHQTNLDRYVALKVMHAYLAEEEEFVDRFKREAAAVARLRHPNIVQVHDFDVRNEELYFMVMEYIEGPTLKAELDVRALQAEPFSLIETTHIITRLAHAIEYAHVRGMVHRDIKPANVMFTSDGQIILTDFGIVRMIGYTYNTNTGFLAGTPAYMSPEQGRGKHGDERSDTYALGVILYELLAGRPPFNADTPLGLIKQHIESPFPSPSAFNPKITPEIEAILEKALAKEPEDRYQRAAELALALQATMNLTAEDMLYPPPIKTIAAPTTTSESLTPLTPVLMQSNLETAVQSSPYRGLFAFAEEDAKYFFGREAFTDRLLTAVQSQPMVVVIGPSGSGKSSVVQAGLLPRLREEEGWLILALRPGSKPFYSLASAIAPQLEPNLSQTGQIQQIINMAHALRQGTATLHEVIQQLLQKQQSLEKHIKLLLFVDQFEEIYTLCADQTIRKNFLDALLELVDIQQFAEKTYFTFVLTLRTDFLSQALHYRPFADALQNADIKLGPMNRRELSLAVANPARRQGLKFETGLVARILDDVGNEPGNLPLLEFALESLWDNRENQHLSHAAYESIGAVEGALARYADDIFNQLTPAEKELAHRIFIQMVRPGSGTEDTRRLATREELGEENWKLVQKLATARLVVTSRDPSGSETVEVVHEALIRGWQLLRQWMMDDRNFRAWQERLRAAQMQWVLAQYDGGALLRGLPLTEAESWFNEREIYLSQQELDFIRASMEARDAEIVAKEQVAEEQRRMKEQERAERARAEENERRAEESAQYARRLMRLAIALVVVMVLAIIAALSSAQNGRRAANSAATAVANERTAIDAQQTAIAALQESEANLILLATAERVAADRAKAEETSAEEADQARGTAVAIADQLEVALADAEESAAQAQLAREEAEQQSRISTSRELASNALAQLQSDPQLALLLALESTHITLSVNEDPPPDTQNALYRALLASQLDYTLSGHTDQISAVSFSSDGSLIATASRDSTAKVWDAVTGRELFTLDPIQHTRAITSITFTPDGSMIATGGEDGFIILWDGFTGSRLSVLLGQAAVIDMAFNPDGSRLATVNSDKTVRIWSIRARDSLFTLFDHRANLTAVRYSPDGARFATSGDDGRVVFWNAENGSPLNSIDPELGQENDSINGLAFNPTGEMVITAHSDGVARVWDTDTNEFRFRLTGHSRALVASEFSPDGSQIATASVDGTVKVWDVETNQALFTLKGHEGGITAVTFSPDGSQIATASQDATARVWNATSGLFPRILTGARDTILDIAFNADGTLAATGGVDKSARIWNVETGVVVQIFDDHNAAINAIDFSPDSSLLATASDDFNVRLWNLQSRELLFLEHDTRVLDVMFSLDGKLIASAEEDGDVRIWESDTRRTVVRLPHETAVQTLAFNPASTHLATGSLNGVVNIWQIDTAVTVLSFTAHNGPINEIAYSPDGTVLATAGNDGTARLWHVASGELIATLTEHSGAVLSVAFNHDGSRLATGSADKTAKLWDTQTGQSLLTFLGHSSTINAVKFSSDGSELATASADRTAQINRLDNVRELFDRGMELRERLLTEAECAQYLHDLTCITLETQLPDDQ